MGKDRGNGATQAAGSGVRTVLTYEEARRIAVDWSGILASPDTFVTDYYLEDADDYMICWDYHPKVPRERYTYGGGNVFVNKHTREAWSSDEPFVTEKVQKMTPVGDWPVESYEEPTVEEVESILAV